MTKETREQNRIKQEKEHEAWRALPEEQKKKEIEARKALYQAELVEKEAKDSAFEASIARGREFNKKVKPLQFLGRLFSYDVSAAAILRTDEDGRNVYYEVAYAIRARRDDYNYSRGLHLAGYRLEQSMISEGSLPLHPSRFKIHISPKGALKKQHLAALIHAHLIMDVVTQNIAGPERMMRIAARCTDWEDNHLTCITPDPKLEKVKKAKKEVSA